MNPESLTLYRNLVISAMLVFVFSIGYSFGMSHGKETITNYKVERMCLSRN